MVQKTPPETLIKHKKFFCENIIFVTKFFSKTKTTCICEYLAKSIDFDGKSFKLAKSRCSENSKLIRQVNEVQKIPLRRHNLS